MGFFKVNASKSYDQIARLSAATSRVALPSYAAFNVANLHLAKKLKERCDINKLIVTDLGQAKDPGVQSQLRQLTSRLFANGAGGEVKRHQTKVLDEMGSLSPKIKKLLDELSHLKTQLSKPRAFRMLSSSAALVSRFQSRALDLQVEVRVHSARVDKATEAITINATRIGNINSGIKGEFTTIITGLPNVPQHDLALRDFETRLTNIRS